MRTTEHGSRLYSAWKRLRAHPHCEEWESYQVFYTWAIYNGYSLGAWLRLIDPEKPYGPDNCHWILDDKASAPDPTRAKEWNDAINRIRKNLGMPPLEGT
jgi:hypothetical protein